LSVVASPRGANLFQIDQPPEESNVEQAIGWIESMEQRARQMATKGPITVFGTSIAATWLTATIGADNVLSYVDEDVARHGNRHLGKPVIAPRDVPRGTPVFICLSPGLAQAVAKRMNAAGLNCVI
jgi:hypothetical protein